MIGTISKAVGAGNKIARARQLARVKSIRRKKRLIDAIKRADAGLDHWARVYVGEVVVAMEILDSRPTQHNIGRLHAAIAKLRQSTGGAGEKLTVDERLGRVIFGRYFHHRLAPLERQLKKGGGLLLTVIERKWGKR